VWPGSGFERLSGRASLHARTGIVNSHSVVSAIADGGRPTHCKSEPLLNIRQVAAVGLVDDLDNPREITTQGHHRGTEKTRREHGKTGDRVCKNGKLSTGGIARGVFCTIGAHSIPGPSRCYTRVMHRTIFSGWVSLVSTSKGCEGRRRHRAFARGIQQIGREGDRRSDYRGTMPPAALTTLSALSVFIVYRGLYTAKGKGPAGGRSSTPLTNSGRYGAGGRAREWIPARARRGSRDAA